MVASRRPNFLLQFTDDLFFLSFQVVLAPIAIGMTLNKFFPSFVKKILPFAPVVGVVSTCLLVASAIAQVADPIKNAGMALQVCSLQVYSCILFLPPYILILGF